MRYSLYVYSSSSHNRRKIEARCRSYNLPITKLEYDAQRRSWNLEFTQNMKPYTLSGSYGSVLEKLKQHTPYIDLFVET